MTSPPPPARPAPRATERGRLVLSHARGGARRASLPHLRTLVAGDLPLVIVDIDGTIATENRTASLRFAFGISPRRVPTLPDAAAGVRRLLDTHEVVLLTARPSWLASRTRSWLRHHGFPSLPVIHPRGLLVSRPSREAYKTRAVARLRALGMRVDLGVGNLVLDVAAYARNDVPPLLIVHGDGRTDLSEARRHAGADLRWLDAAEAWRRIPGLIA